MAAKKQISIKKNCLVVCLLFFFLKWMAYSPFLPSFKRTMPTWFMHDKEEAASGTERITVVLAIPYTTTMGSGDNRTHFSTYHRQTTQHFPGNATQRPT